MSQQPASIGRIVHVRVGGEDDSPVLRPAIIVRVWGDTCVNAIVHLDGRNDDVYGRLDGECGRHVEVGTVWCTSISLGEGVGNWRWPAR